MRPQAERAYAACLIAAARRHAAGELKLCPRGYCTAKEKFEVYPSAYANSYAASVCEGAQPDSRGQTAAAAEYAEHDASEAPNALRVWHKQDWRNVCAPDPNAACGYEACGTGDGVAHPESYPYCRPCHKVGSTLTTIGEMSKQEIRQMCAKKRRAEAARPRSTSQTSQAPTRVFVHSRTSSKARAGKRRASRASATSPERATAATGVAVPADVREAAAQALALHEEGRAGGTHTGWHRAQQLATAPSVDPSTLRAMRTWFARHGPDAKNGGTSYGAPACATCKPRGYCEYRKSGVPNRGAVAWLLWGGSPAYRWLKTREVRDVLQNAFPRSKASSAQVRLPCDDKDVTNPHDSSSTPRGGKRVDSTTELLKLS